MNEISIGILCTALGALLGIVGYMRNAKKDTKEEAGNATRVEIKLDYAITGINEIKSDIKDTKKDIGDLADRLTRVEESTKSAHHRIDNYEREGITNVR
jgi:hypothetical protein